MFEISWYTEYTDKSLKGALHMRTCLRCETKMVENLVVMSSDGYGLTVREKGFFKGSLGKVSSAVCPACGYTEFYVENTEKIKQAAEKETSK